MMTETHLLLTVVRERLWLRRVRQVSQLVTRKRVLHATLKIDLDQSVYVDLTDKRVRVVPDTPFFLPEDVRIVLNCKADLTEVLRRVEDEIKEGTYLHWASLFWL